MGSAMDIETLELPGCVVLRPGDELDLLGYLSFGENIDGLMRDGKKQLVIDLELVTFLTASTARVFIAITKKAKDSGGAVALAEVRDGPRIVLDATGALGALSTFATVQEAVASMEAA